MTLRLLNWVGAFVLLPWAVVVLMALMLYVWRLS